MEKEKTVGALSMNSQKLILSMVRPLANAGLIPEWEFSGLREILKHPPNQYRSCEERPQCLISTPQMCKILGISRPSLFELRKSGKLHGIRVGPRKVYFTKPELDRYLLENLEFRD